MKIEEEEFQFTLRFTTSNYLPEGLTPLEDKYLDYFSDLDREVAFQIAEKTGGKVKVYKYEHWIYLLVVTKDKVVKIADIRR